MSVIACFGRGVNCLGMHPRSWSNRRASQLASQMAIFSPKARRMIELAVAGLPDNFHREQWFAWSRSHAEVLLQAAAAPCAAPSGADGPRHTTDAAASACAGDEQLPAPLCRRVPPGLPPLAAEPQAQTLLDRLADVRGKTLHRRQQGRVQPDRRYLLRTATRHIVNNP